MRDILFKAKRLDNGEWVEGDYAYRPKESGDNLERHYILVHDDYGFRWYEVYPETICQYTGLTDKNGKKIWENDILRYSYDYEDSPWLKSKGLTNEDIKYSIGAVFWSDWRASWAVCGKGKSRSCNQNVFTYSRNPNRTEGIGNIFDNPELLEN